eukprot:10042043-Karenia_brevis.AAC.1
MKSYFDTFLKKLLLKILTAFNRDSQFVNGFLIRFMVGDYLFRQLMSRIALVKAALGLVSGPALICARVGPDLGPASLRVIANSTLVLLVGFIPTQPIIKPRRTKLVTPATTRPERLIYDLNFGKFPG